MTSKDRVTKALRKEPVDRIPVFMWFHPDTAGYLGQLLEIPADAVGEAMGDDIIQTWVNNNHAMEGITHEQDGEGHVDVWGIHWTKQGAFNQVTHSPLETASDEELLSYSFPVDHMEDLLNNMKPLLPRSESQFFGCDVSPCVFELYCRLRGMEQSLLDLMLQPELASQMLKRCGEFSRDLAQEACSRFPLDWLWTGDDVASQQGMMMSPETWRRLIKPYLQLSVDVGKRHDLWVAYHCCGSLRPIIPDLIEMGIDVLNPLQANCPGMDAVELKREFGDHLNFMGGVDTQGLLPTASPKQIRRETERLIREMTRDGGGYILAASHTVPPETPDDNIFAMYEAAGITRTEIFDRAADIRARRSQN